MQFADLSTLSKMALGLALAGFLISISALSTSSVNGVTTCEYYDYGKLVIGGLAVMVGGMGEVVALRNAQTRTTNLVASGSASVVGIFHILAGIGFVGGPC